MTKYNAKWVSLYNKLSQAEKSLSVQKRKADILAQSNSRLVKDNMAWAKSYTHLAANHSELLALYNSLLERSKLNDCEGTSAEE
jgi:hypothetical protein